MILVLKKGLDRCRADAVRERLQQLGLTGESAQSIDTTYIIVCGEAGTMPAHLFTQIDGVEKVIDVSARCPMVFATKREQFAATGPAAFAGQSPFFIAGPCSVESEEQILAVAQAVKAVGAHALRGGAYKPRSNPYDFRGLGKPALEFLAHAKAVTGLPVVSEVMSAEQLAVAHDYIDIFQVGARNMYNFELLRELGRTRKPILLKRAMSATIDEFLQAAEYILLEGNPQVILCERGVRTFETRTRNTLDLNAVAVLKSLIGLPVIVDPSHGTGRSSLVKPMALAAIACGADGLIIETHCCPEKSVSDADQAVTPEELAEIVSQVKAIAQIVKPQSSDCAPPAVTPEQKVLLGQH
jgi:3-deoxy-7-phosphoheptulonate synthase